MARRIKVLWQIARACRLPHILVLGAALALASAAPARAADSALSCAAASQLVQQALPRRALAVVDATRAVSGVADDCREPAALANERLLQSSELSQQAREQLADQDWDSAKNSAQKALDADSENQTATEQLRQASTKQAAQIEAKKTWVQTLLDQWDLFAESYLAPAGELLLPFTLALAVLLMLTRLLVNLVPSWPEADDLPPLRQRTRMMSAGLMSLVGGAWGMSVSTSDALLPTTHPAVIWPTTAVGFAAGVMASGVAAKVSPQKRSERAVQDGLVLIGVVAALGGALGMILQAMGADDLSDALDGLALLFFGAALSALGVSIMAWWLATRIRVSIAVSDSSGSSQSAKVALVAAHLNELGAEKPRGLEVPHGTDVTALEGAFSTLPDNAVLRAVKSFVTGISGVTPWSATIDAGTDSVAVAVRRNGRSQDSAVIVTKTLLAITAADATSKTSVKGQEGTPPSTDKEAADADSLDDLALKFAAAHVLATMAKGHPSIRGGLGGATDWASIGLNYVATTDPQYSGSKQQQLLAKAVDTDPNNQSAALAFRHSMYREATTRDDLSEYLRWLSDFDNSLGEEIRYENATLRLRTRYTRAAIALNALFALPLATPPTSGQQGDRVESLRVAKQAFEDLNQAIDKAGPISAELNHFCAQFRSDMQASRHLLGLEEGEPPESRSIFGLYNLACYFASHNDIHLTGVASDVLDEDESKAVRYLLLARTLPDLRGWMAKDPQLAAFVGGNAYKKAFLAEPRTELLELEPFTPHATRLRVIGYSEPAVLSRMSRSALAKVLNVHRSIADEMIELAALRVSQADALRDIGLEVLAELRARGLADRLAIRRLGDSARRRAAIEVVTDVLARCYATADTQPLSRRRFSRLVRDWLDNVRPPDAP